MTSSAIQRTITNILADAFAFVRGQEINKSIAAVTLEELLEEQILRNGETGASKSSQFDPYAFDPSAPVLGTKAPLPRANFAGVSNVNQPTKMDRLIALQAGLEAAIKQIKDTPIDTVNAPALEDLGSVLESDNLISDSFQGG